VLSKVLIVAKIIKRTNLLLDATKLFNKLLLIYFAYLTLRVCILTLLFVLIFCCTFFLIVSFLVKFINLRRCSFFDFNNKIINVKSTIKIRYIIIFKWRYLKSNNIVKR